ncbi:YceI family protein [Draconibacterium sp. IB214405]|uniref:YceI family protein n=1 Tax=Draconibacterium sp. IB214405 TaxID=3097352 RepID=UPI002A143E66|nr:YceI family protein [Draconibacterium sp. IB214405]MDX8337620.1 YceI family protein [Draconibacterium sp. IB214405]
MKKVKLYNKLIISLFAILLASNLSVAQVSYEQNSSNSKLMITGTSSIHDWEMAVEDYNCLVSASADENQQISIESIDFSCTTESITSHNKIMDGKAHKALDSDDHPKISFTAGGKVSASASSVNKTKGKLQIAGKEKEVELEFSVNETEADQFKVAGKIPLKMSDFGIDPPTAMMGTLKTGDEVVIHFDIVFQNKQTSQLGK